MGDLTQVRKLPSEPSLPPHPFQGLIDPRCRRCGLQVARTLVVPGSGPVDARLCIIGEAPGKREDLGGRPFIGRAGSILDAALENAGLSREDVFMTNVVKCRPPGNRNPAAEEISACAPLLDGELERLDPDLVLTMGIVPARRVLDGSGVRWKNLGEVAGRTFLVDLGGRERKVMVNYHPAACIYNRRLLRRMEEIMMAAARMLG